MSRYSLFVVLSVALVVVDILGLTTVPTELSALISAASDAADNSQIMTHALRMVAAVLCVAGADIGTVLFAVKTAVRLGHDLRMAIYKKSLDFSSTDFDRIGTASMVTRTLTDINVIQQTYILIFTCVLLMPVLCVITIIKTYAINVAMGHMMLVFTLVLLVLMCAAVALTSPIFQSLQTFVDRINKRLRENIIGVRVICAFTREPQARARLDSSFSDYAEQAIKANVLFCIFTQLIFLAASIANVTVMYMSPFEVGTDALKIAK